MTPFRIFAGLFGYSRMRSFYARAYSPMMRPTAANFAFEHSNTSGVFMSGLFGLGDPPTRKTCAVIFVPAPAKAQSAFLKKIKATQKDLAIHPPPDFYAQTVILDASGKQIEVYGWGDHCDKLQKKLDEEYKKELKAYTIANFDPKHNRKPKNYSLPGPSQAQLNQAYLAIQDAKNKAALDDSRMIMAKASIQGQLNMDALLAENAALHKAVQDAVEKFRALTTESSFYFPAVGQNVPSNTPQGWNVPGELPSPGPGLTSDEVLAMDAANHPAQGPDTGTHQELTDIAAQYPGIYQRGASKKVRHSRLHGLGATRRKHPLALVFGRVDPSKKKSGEWVPITSGAATGSPSNMNISEDKPSSPGTKEGQISDDGQWRWTGPSPDAQVISELKQAAQQVKKHPQQAAKEVAQDAPMIQKAVQQVAAASVSDAIAGGVTPSLDDPQLISAMNALVAIMDKFDKPLSNLSQVESLQSKMTSWGLTHGAYMKKFDNGKGIPGLPPDVSVQSVILEHPNESIGKTADDVRADMEIVRKVLSGKAQIYYWGKKAYDIKKAYDAYQKQSAQTGSQPTLPTFRPKPAAPQGSILPKPWTPASHLPPSIIVPPAGGWSVPPQLSPIGPAAVEMPLPFQPTQPPEAIPVDPYAFAGLGELVGL